MTEPTPQPIPQEWRTELEDCYRREARGLWGHVFLFTRRDRQTTDDVVQDTYRAAAVKWKKLRSLKQDQLAGWLYGTATNIAVDYFRSNERARRYQAEVWHRLYRPPTHETYQLALTEAALKHCWNVIERMPPRRHEVVLLRWRCGYSYREISSMLGMNEKTVSAHVSAARKMLIDEVSLYLPFDVKPQEGGPQS